MKRIIVGLQLLAALLLVKTGMSQEQTLMTVAGKNVTLREFENIYKKNNFNSQAVDQKSLEEYVELFINFKLKVKEAEVMGLDTQLTFIRELAGYRHTLAQPYLTDKEEGENLIKEAYERMKLDVNASHILVKLDQNASPEDTAKAFKKIQDIRKMIMKGGNFEDIAKKMSEDESAKMNNGNLGYFTVFRMVYPFESAAYNTPVGQVSEPIRTRFGYHILKVNDKRPARGEVKIGHIMAVAPADGTADKLENAEKRIQEIYTKLQAGESFEDLAKNYSDDKSSAKNGGELQWFGTGKMVPEFENAAFELAENGHYSKPFKTQYGWHIVKRLDKKDIGSYEEVYNELKNKVSRDGRSMISRDRLIAKIKEWYHFAPDMKARNEFYALADSSLFKGSWLATKAAGKNKVLFTLTDNEFSKTSKAYTQQDFASFIEGAQRREVKADGRIMINNIWDKFVEESCINFENANLEAKYPDFKALVQEYRDGILLFELMDQKVWSKAVKDTTGLENFYSGHKTEFMWDSRLDASVYTCANEEIANSVLKMVKKQQKKKYADSVILEEINKDSQLNVKIEHSKFLKGDNELIDGIAWSPGYSPMKKVGEQTVFVLVHQKLEPQPKELSEARGLITAKYQNFLEEEWLKELRNKYSYSVDQQVLKLIK